MVCGFGLWECDGRTIDTRDVELFYYMKSELSEGSDKFILLGQKLELCKFFLEVHKK